MVFTCMGPQPKTIAILIGKKCERCSIIVTFTSTGNAGAISCISSMMSSRCSPKYPTHKLAKLLHCRVLDVVTSPESNPCQVRTLHEPNQVGTQTKPMKWREFTYQSTS
jgi:hypothetical protein